MKKLIYILLSMVIISCHKIPNNPTFYAINPFTATGNYTYIPTIKTTRYYRLKIVKSDLSIVYSSIVSIL